MMERYEKYKDSGVEWIGEIPDGWEVKKLKYGVTVNPSKDNVDKTSSELVVFLPMEKVTEGGAINCSIKKPISDLYNGFTCFRKNDVIVAKITPCFENGKGAFLNKLETEIGFGSTEFHVLRVQKDMCDLFLYYVTKSEIFMKVGEAFMSGAAGQKRVPTNFIADFPLVLPSKPEQTAIANYLDLKTAEIDQLIAQKEALLRLYEEEKTAIINQAVTQGINPDVKLKDSSIDWLGEIPEHWEISRARFISHVFVPQRNKPELNSDNGLPWLTMEDMSSDKITKTKLNVSEEASKNAGSKVLKKGSVVASCVGNFGVCAINIVDVIINQQLQAFIPHNNIVPKYLLETVKISKDYFQMIATEATLVYVNQSGFSNMPILLPPHAEQSAIVHHIETETTRINTKISKTKQIIALQKEYRTALISEVVTGKIKVTQEMAR